MKNVCLCFLNQGFGRGLTAVFEWMKEGDY